MTAQPELHPPIGLADFEVDALLDKLLLNPLAEISGRQALDWAMHNFYAFMLVLVRLSGLMTIGPLFGQSVAPANIRVMLVLSLSLLLTPTLASQSQNGFRRL